MQNPDGRDASLIEPARWKSSHVLLLIAAGSVLLLWWIDRPFGVLEQNPAIYFGPFIRNFEHFGFFELKGLPLGLTLLDTPARGMPYLNHPPGFSWTLYLFGTAEWQMRLCTSLGLMASSVLAYLFLVRRCGPPAALFAGLLLMVTPVMSFYAQGSYEPVVMPLGLTMCLAMERLTNDRLSRRARLGWRIALAGAALIGPWMDWAFVYFCIALVPLAWQPGSFKATLRNLALPAICAAVSQGLHLYWRQMIVGGDQLAGNRSVSQLMEDSVWDPPALAEVWQAWSQRIPHSFTIPLLIATVLGLLALWRSDRRLAIILGFLAVIHPLIFIKHTMQSHEMFFGYTALLTSTATALAIFRGPFSRLPAPARAVVLAIAFLWPAWSTFALIRATDTTFFRDQGAVASAATAAMSPDETPGPYLVLHNDPPACSGYGYYADSWLVQPLPIRTADALQQWLDSLPKRAGARYLWLRMEDLDGKPVAITPGLEEMFAPLDKARRPELELELNVDGRGHIVRIREAWLVTLREPAK